MKIEDLTLAQVTAIAKIGKETASCDSYSQGAKKQIVVLDRGFVYVGDVSIDRDFVVIEHAKNIRVWGTTKGLGELRGGPLSNTTLDDVGTVRAPVRALIHLIDVDSGKWNA
jgi:hypothetical protein